MLIIDILRFMSISKGFQGRGFSLNKRSCVGVFDWLVGWLVGWLSFTVVGLGRVAII